MANNIFRVEDLIAQNASINELKFENTGDTKFLISKGDSDLVVSKSNLNEYNLWNPWDDILKINSSGVESYGDSSPYWLGKNHSNTDQGFAIILQKTRGLFPSSYDIVQSNDMLGEISFQGTDGTINKTATFIRSRVDATPSSDSIPTRLTFATTSQGDTSASEKMRITNSGYVGIGTMNPLVKLDINGESQIIANSDITPALLIDQLGSGNALSVQNSINPNFQPITIDPLGRLLVGHTVTTGTSPFQVSRSGSQAISSFRYFANNNLPGEIYLLKERGPFGGPPIIAQSGDAVFNIHFLTNDGDRNYNTATIQSYVDGVPSDGSIPGGLIFKTTASGQTFTTERLKIDSNGNLSISGNRPTVNSTGILLIGEASTQSYVTGISGGLQTQITNLNSGTGNYYPRNNPSGYITGVNLSTYATQSYVTGISGGLQTQITNLNNDFLGIGDLVFATGNQTISGLKTFVDLEIATSDQFDINNARTTAGLLIRNVSGTTGINNYSTAVVLSKIDSFRPGGAIASVQTSTDSDQLGIAFLTHESSTLNDVLVEKVRIQHDGDVGIGVTNPQTKLHVSGEITSSTLGTGGGNFRAIQGNYGSFWRNNGTNLYLMITNSGNQYGTFNSLRPFVANLANGNVGIGNDPGTTVSFYNRKNIEGSTTAYSNFTNAEVQSGVTTSAKGYATSLSTDAAPFTLTNLIHYEANQGIIGVDSMVTNQYGFVASSSLAGADLNYGFHSNVIDGPGYNHNFYANGTAPNYFKGNLRLGSSELFFTQTALSISPTSNNKSLGIYHVGTDDSVYIYNGDRSIEDFIINSNGKIAIGGLTSNAVSFYNRKNIGGSATAYANYTNAMVQSGVTGTAYINRTLISLESTSFTLNSLIHYEANQSTFGIDSVVNNQYGFLVPSSLVGATNDYGFYSNIASGAGRWNFFANGTAENRFNGNVGLGLDPEYKLHLSTDSAAKPGAGGLWTISSDERLKENIELADLDICYNAVKNIPLKRFRWKDDVYSDEQINDRNNIGWIAQDVKTIFPKAVGQYKFVYNQVKDEDGNIISEDSINDCLSLNADQLYAALFGAVKKLMGTVENLQARIDQLENK